MNSNVLSTQMNPLQSEISGLDPNAGLSDQFPVRASAGSLSKPDLDKLGNFQRMVNLPSSDRAGSSGNNQLLGSNRNDRLYGLAGNDWLRGSQGNDILTGGTGKDILVGGQGKDLLVDDFDGGDRMTGGKDADIFSVGNWGKTTTRNLITDFAVGSDRIKVGRLGATFANLTIRDSVKGAIVSDGDHQIAILQGVEAAQLQPDSFIFGDAALADRLEKALNKSRAPGTTQAIVTPDGFTWEGAAGVSNLATQTPTRSEDIFAIASVTKPFTAAAVLKLAEAGTLNLDDTLGKWLPEIAAKIPEGQDITLRQLLNGTSGIPDFTGDRQYLADAEADIASGANRPFKPEEIVAYTYDNPRFSGQRSSPTWVYPNTGYIIAGLIVEKATNKPFAQVVREQVLEPLGLTSTFLNGKEQIVGNRSRGYDDYKQADGSPGRDGTLDDVTNLNPSLLGGPEGGLVSNAQDVARFYRSLLSGELLQPNSQKELLTFVSTPEGEDFGLGVSSVQNNLGNYYGTGGNIPGYRSAAIYFPEKGGTTVSTLINRSEVLGDSGDDRLTPIVKASLDVIEQTWSDRRER